MWLLKGTVIQIEKALINDRLRVSKESWKFRITTIHNFAVIYLTSKKKIVVFSVCKQNFTTQ